MSDISSVSSTQKLITKPKVSLESASQTQATVASSSTQDIEAFEAKMEQIERGFALVQEIRASLESALQKLSPHN